MVGGFDFASPGAPDDVLYCSAVTSTSTVTSNSPAAVLFRQSVSQRE